MRALNEVKSEKTTYTARVDKSILELLVAAQELLLEKLCVLYVLVDGDVDRVSGWDVLELYRLEGRHGVCDFSECCYVAVIMLLLADVACLSRVSKSVRAEDPCCQVEADDRRCRMAGHRAQGTRPETVGMPTRPRVV